MHLPTRQRIRPRTTKQIIAITPDPIDVLVVVVVVAGVPWQVAKEKKMKDSKIQSKKGRVDKAFFCQ